jgi:type I restriction enzyme S subunit
MLCAPSSRKEARNSHAHTRKRSGEDAGGAGNRMSIDQSSAELAKQSAWPVDRIKDHASKIGSGITPTGGATTYLDTGIPLLRSQNIHFDGLQLDDVAFIAEETHNEMSGTKLRAGDVLLNITGASIGRCAFIPDGFGEGNVNQHVCIVRPSSKLNHRFLNYCLSAPWGQDQIFSSFTGASRQGLGQRDLGAIQIPLPPMPEQERIVAYLDASCGAIDAAVVAKRRQIETLDAVRESLIEAAVTGGIQPEVSYRRIDSDWISKVPVHWDVVRIKRLVSRIDYGISENTVKEGRYPVLKMGHIQRGELSLSNLDFVEKTVTVITDDGMHWNVSPSLLRRAEPSGNADFSKSNLIPLKKK